MIKPRFGVLPKGLGARRAVIDRCKSQKPTGLGADFVFFAKPCRRHAPKSCATVSEPTRRTSSVRHVDSTLRASGIAREPIFEYLYETMTATCSPTPSSSSAACYTTQCAGGPPTLDPGLRVVVTK